MRKAKLSSKNQITVPREVREELQVGRGDWIRFEPTADGRFLVAKAAPIQRSDGAARRLLRGKVPPSPTASAAAIMQTVIDEDHRTRSAR